MILEVIRDLIMSNLYKSDVVCFDNVSGMLILKILFCRFYSFSYDRVIVITIVVLRDKVFLKQ